MMREKTFLYQGALVMAKLLFSLFFRSSCRGAEHFPKDEPCILIANHISAWDPILVARYFPYSEVRFLAKEQLFAFKPLGAYLAAMHAIRVNRGDSDLGALRASLQVLREGHVLGVFPEGHRHPDGDHSQIEAGAAVIALKSRAKVVPMYITGQYRFFGRPRLTVGAPTELSDLYALRPDARTLDLFGERVLEEFAKLAAL